MVQKKMERVARLTMAAVALGMGFGLAGCKTDRSGDFVGTDREARQEASNDYQPEPVGSEPAPVRVRGIYEPNPGPGFGVTGLAFPTGDVESSALMLYQVMPMQVRRNSGFDVEYHVHNLTDGTLQNVMVMLESTDNLNIRSSDPQATTSGGSTNFNIGDLAPRSTRIITINAEADRVGIASNCISVSYNNILCAATEVVEPAIEIAKTATPRVLLCEPITLTYRVTNTGTGPAENVTVSDTLPRCIEVNGRNSVSIPVGTLMAGESRDVSVVAEATCTGTFGSSASAMSGDLSASSGQPETVVVQPVLEIECEARDFQFLGRNATYTFTVRNTGDGEARDARISASIPGNTTMVRASDGGSAAGGNVNWSLGTLGPNQSRSVELVLGSSTASTARVTARAEAFCAEPVSTSCETEFRGIPAILLEVVDVTDPVEVGQQTTYIIRVTNQGTADDTNVRIVCELPAAQQFVSAGGATSASTRGNTISFAPVARLAPKAVVEWSIIVRANDEGDVRFGAELTSDNLTSPVIETESTNLYR
ncbi:MAG: hypothetical protein AAGD00_03570 [Planctomycetota bacterium]